MEMSKKLVAASDKERAETYRALASIERHRQTEEDKLEKMQETFEEAEYGMARQSERRSRLVELDGANDERERMLEAMEEEEAELLGVTSRGTRFGRRMRGFGGRRLTFDFEPAEDLSPEDFAAILTRPPPRPGPGRFGPDIEALFGQSDALGF